ncbi:hypothetical protein RRG08_038025 [Elysia crispata]|uniref:Uncharacterized protein n=1 Tax=Elysia crispata TaxID=231223 RepID=A0AAE0ZYF5_9GAST|nr:hypothetical protein RRG08_038025 [Elysia crispata]
MPVAQQMKQNHALDNPKCQLFSPSGSIVCTFTRTFQLQHLLPPLDQSANNLGGACAFRRFERRPISS